MRRFLVRATQIPDEGLLGRIGNVCYWHKADMLNALTNVRFWGKADIDKPLPTNLDL